MHSVFLLVKIAFFSDNYIIRNTRISLKFLKNNGHTLFQTILMEYIHLYKYVITIIDNWLVIKQIYSFSIYIEKNHLTVLVLETMQIFVFEF